MNGKKKWALVALILITAILAMSCAAKKGEETTMLNFTSPKAGDKIATIQTDKGDIKVMFFPSVAPKAVENFITHSEKGYYDGLIFHRVIKDFMIQGGDPTGTGRGGESIWGSPFKNEVSDTLHNFRGALAMANSGKDTNGSQFFIVQAGPVSEANMTQFETQRGQDFPDNVKKKYEEVGGAPWLDGGYTVFGQVIEGMDVVDKIASVDVDANSKPLTPIKIVKITVDTQK